MFRSEHPADGTGGQTDGGYLSILSCGCADHLQEGRTTGILFGMVAGESSAPIPLILTLTSNPNPNPDF